MRRQGDGRKRQVVLDADEWEHLPTEVYIPVRGVANAGDEAMVELHEMTDARMALLAYSTPDRLISACGVGQSAMKLPARDLPRLRRRLRFHAILLDVSQPGEPVMESDVAQPLPLTIDNATGEPIVFVPSRSFRHAERRAQLELQRMADGKLALMTYSSRAALSDGCGPNQHFVTFPVGQLAQVQRKSGAHSVLIDVPLPPHLRH
ncbi:MAG TPA: SAV_915 family protein [Pseudonocardiaceae bacterium]